MKAQNILETIGNTPHLRINNLFGKEHEVWIKMEKNNPGASIKDRIALAMIEDAEAKGILKEGVLGVLKIQWQSLFKNYRRRVKNNSQLASTKA